MPFLHDIVFAERPPVTILSTGVILVAYMYSAVARLDPVDIDRDEDAMQLHPRRKSWQSPWESCNSIHFHGHGDSAAKENSPLSLNLRYALFTPY